MYVQTWTIEGQGFHFGRQGLGQEVTAVVFSSDSLFAALVSRLAERGGSAAVESFMAPFLAGSPPFVLTTCFPRLGQVRLFPLPALPPGKSEHLADSVPTHKDLKRVRFVSEGLFRRLLRGEKLAQLYPQALVLQGKSVLVDPGEVHNLRTELREAGARLWSVDKRPRVTLGRAVQNSSIFFTGRVSFREECGLWFGVRWLQDAPELKELLAGLLVDLADSGLGAERSTGFGAATIEAGTDIELPDAAGKPWTNLSRYLPAKAELPALSAQFASYRLEQVGGWLDSPARRGQRRIPLNMLAEGAVLGALDVAAPGVIEDVRPSYAGDPDPVGHPVYRSGLAFAVGVEGGLQ